MAGNSGSHRKPNIRMVAKRARLSPTTVSLALRGDDSIPQQTRERVLAAARELNYVHTPRSLRAAQPDICRLAFVMPDFGDHPVTANPFYGQVLAGAEQECAERNASLMFTALPRMLATDQQLPMALHSDDLAGLLLVGPYPPALVERLAAGSRRPFVLVDNYVPGQAYDSATADDYNGGYMATQHLLSLGHRQIAMIAGDLQVPTFAERYRGYRAACRAAGVEPMEAIQVEHAAEPMSAMLAQVLAQLPRPTAFFCVGDAFAVSLMDLARDFGYKTPDDFSVVGFDNLEPVPLARPPLTTIQNHPRALGRIAVQRLLARISGDRLPPQRVAVGLKLVVRESTRQI